MENKVYIPKTLPLLPIREAVVFPYMLLSFYVGRENSKKAVEEALNKNRIIFLSTQKKAQEEIISENSVFKMGTASIILRKRVLKDGRLKILVQGLSRALIKSIYQEKDFYMADIEEVPHLSLPVISKSLLDSMNSVKETLKTLTALGGSSSPDLLMILNDIDQPGKLADLIAGHLELKPEDMQIILESIDPEKRLQQLQNILNKELELIRMQNRIKKMVKNNLSNFSNNELNQSSTLSYMHSGGESKNEEIQELTQKIQAIQMPEETRKEVLKQVSRLEKMHSESSEASIVRSYLDWVIDLPWDKSTKDSLDLKKAQDILERDHFGLHEVKERILEFFSCS